MILTGSPSDDQRLHALLDLEQDLIAEDQNDDRDNGDRAAVIEDLIVMLRWSLAVPAQADAAAVASDH